MSTTAAPGHCLNCGHTFGAERLAYCPACGQETQVKPPTLGEFAQQFGGAYFSTEGALWRTLKLLLLKPGELTRQYLDGRRRHYVLPLRLYLTISVVVLLLVRLVSTVNVDVKPGELDAMSKENRNFSIKLGHGRAGMRDGVFYCNELPAWVCRRVQRRIDFDPKAMASEIETMKDRFLGNVGAAMFLLLPSFALWLKLVYLNRRLRYTEHLVFALHVHAFWFGALALMLSNVSLVVLACMLVMPVYTLLAMRRVYGGRWWPRLLRAALVCTLYGVVLTLAIAGVAVWTLLS